MGIQLNSDKDKVSITAVLGKSPADLAGLKAGDQIIEINKKKVSSLGDAHRLTAEAAAGKELQLLIRRDGKTETFKLMMGDGL
jgi:S1-C subfamily serine protease